MTKSRDTFVNFLHAIRQRRSLVHRHASAALSNAVLPNKAMNVIPVHAMYRAMCFIAPTCSILARHFMKSDSYTNVQFICDLK